MRGLLACLLLVLGEGEARALVLQAPLGGDGIVLPHDRVACSAIPEGWTADASRRRLRPPADGKPGRGDTVLLATSTAACVTAPEKVTLIATGPLPDIDAPSVTVFVDSGKLELRGDSLEGVRIGYKAGPVSGSDVCLNVVKDRGKDLCTIAVDRGLPADPLRLTLTWAPMGGRVDDDVITYDKSGTALSDELRHVEAARIVISRVFPPSPTVDVTSGEGHLDLAHPEAVASVDCVAARCDSTPRGVVVRGVPATVQTVSVRIRLGVRVVLAKGEGFDSSVTESLTVLRCPLSVVSGEPVRNALDVAMLVRLDRSCAKDVGDLRFAVSGEPAQVERSETLADGVYVLLRPGRVGERVTVVASRAEDGSVLAVASIKSWDAPPIHTSLLLPGFGEMDFIPKNRDALLSVSPIGRDGQLIPLSLPGAYSAETKKDGVHVRGLFTSGGYASLRFAYRPANLPPEFANESYGTLVDPVQRPIREASVPAPFGASSTSDKPIVELLCTIDHHTKRIEVGAALHIPFRAREGCRLVLHRERIDPTAGEQELDIDVSVTSVAGVERGDAKLTLHLLVRHAADQEVIWIRGAKDQFDRYSIRVTQVIDEAEFITRTQTRVALPSAQWTLTTESADFKFYMTAAIPASLFRFSRDRGDLGTGPLALNFGVLSRFTWLDKDGHDGLIGLEGGAMAMGLETDKQRQLAVVAGLGVSVPLGNVNQPSQAAVNIHAWAAYTFGTRYGDLRDDSGALIDRVKLNPWAFVFGPSITIGNVGAFL